MIQFHFVLGMTLCVVNHPIALHVLGTIRDKNTKPHEIRSSVDRIGSILMAKAFETLPTEDYQVETPLCETMQQRLCTRIIVAPILRAGLALLNSAINVCPEASIGYYGLQRNEETALPEFYYKKLPRTEGADVFVLDPMLATGGSSAYAIEDIISKNPRSVTLVTIVSAKPGIEYIQSRFPNVNIVTVAVDDKLNEKKFIVPGLGDFGDRYNGTQ